ncbi:MazG nucleotide pyrophosphohydrolase domain-containing protein [Streptoalloteichus tenebrarius]|uniref:MazG nucleotide pyrophosphohydrolase domain-containing protein n=1 Tax=Streptoalloteichus tenebrarius (strain ATCC 17920 / DSM 40477 / JCM 4838 / CBS 697.72 / NBRC 16177 / NCIMB 11028 / NRRL B-12390 / A12253. 1 / ISP 5477) TaxID=1933 RepID=A0ABT1HV74_STRSD|nr:nucleotide pyrophosphohydrolase [Streptoalloteichus tenebrarius]MCP2259421.1 MazG nucleotide pyrophosphohydrolase domain-containing protein [Streptoalloteichus tenebrarius]BFF02363.1 nucleotide pyrophosphohydrolase [Streptoalloteichus tenebrarius]
MGSYEELAGRLGEFAAAREWERFHTPKNLAMALAGEAGELVAELQWLTDEEIRAALAEGPLRDRLADEAADVLLYLVRLCSVCDIDLVAAAHAKIARNERRYPVELARGNARKHTELRRLPDSSDGGEATAD